MDMMSLRRRVMVNQNKLMTATGNPITFYTPLEKPLKECVVRFTPQQSGSGTPSPENVREIVGKNGITVWQSGKNLCPAVNGNDLLKWTYESQSRKYTFTNLPPDTPMTLSVTVNEALGRNTGRRLYLRGKNFTYIDTGSSSGRKSITVNTDDTGYIYITHNNTALNDADYRNAITDITLEFGSEDTGYEPYSAPNEITFTFPSTVGDNGVVYGGYVDAEKGEVVAEYAKTTFGTSGWMLNTTTDSGSVFRRIFTGREPTLVGQDSEVYCDSYASYTTVPITQIGTIPNGSICGRGTYSTLFVRDDRYDNIEDFVANMSNAEVAYKLETPIHYPLSPRILTTLQGNNVMWSDANGDITVRYWTR